MDYCSSLDVSLDFSCCDSICDVLRGKQLHSLNSSLLAKPFHDCFFCFMGTDVVEKEEFCMAQTTSTF